MKLIVCIDDRSGMMFHHRRVSSDKAVTEKILHLIRQDRLLMNPYTYRLFDPKENIICVDKPLDMATESDWCFVEDQDLSGALCAADQVIVFHWNRAYPADRFFPLEELREHLPLIYCEDFVGNSHQRITMEVYGR